jgi:hypothetical protein
MGRFDVGNEQEMTNFHHLGSTSKLKGSTLPGVNGGVERPSTTQTRV